MPVSCTMIEVLSGAISSMMESKTVASGWSVTVIWTQSPAVPGKVKSSETARRDCSGSVHDVIADGRSG